jgi:hypothetical protein
MNANYTLRKARDLYWKHLNPMGYIVQGPTEFLILNGKNHRFVKPASKFKFSKNDTVFECSVLADKMNVKLVTEF